MMEEVYRLRYEVYCLDCGFEDPADYPDGLEQDEYDPHSVHFIAYHPTHGIVGTVRLVLDSPLGFPLERYCRVDGEAKRLQRPRLAEISRLAVKKAWRSSAITLGLLKILYQESKRLGLRYWLAAMEKKLERLLRRFSLIFNQIGALVDYHGPRIPFLGVVKSLEYTLATKEPGVFDYFVHGLEHSYRQDALSYSFAADGYIASA
jgi:N-acyl-L-homoserine lactone synthetase